MTLGLDLSDGFVRAVVVDDRAHVHSRIAQPLGTVRGAEALAIPLRQALEALPDAHRGVTRAAIAVPQPADGVPSDVQRTCQELLPKAGSTVAVGIGAATVVAEHWCGAARGLANVVALTAGEHVASGILLGGQVWPGAHGMAGTVGWLSLNPVEREDYRRFGGLEADVSSAGIVRRFIWRIKAGDRSAVVPPHADLSRITVDQVFQGARINDGVCVSVIRDTAKYIGMAASNLAAILDPQAIVLGGAIASWGDILLDAIRHECSRRLSPVQSEQLQILRSDLANEAAAIGAARLAHLSA